MTEKDKEKIKEVIDAADLSSNVTGEKLLDCFLKAIAGDKYDELFNKAKD